MSKTSKLNFSENLNKEQLDINLNHLRSSSSVMNMQMCPQRTKMIRHPACIGRFRLFKLVIHKVDLFLLEFYDAILGSVTSYPLRHHR